MSIEDGGPAFPMPISNGGYSIIAGLTKREYFAGLVLAGISADAETTWSKPEHETKAKYAVKAADALIAELAKEKA